MILLLLLLGALGDLWTSSIGGAGNEANPHALLLMQHGFWLWAAVKLASNGLLVGVWLGLRNSPRAVLLALDALIAVAAAGQLLVTGHNL